MLETKIESISCDLVLLFLLIVSHRHPKYLHSITLTLLYVYVRNLYCDKKADHKKISFNDDRFYSHLAVLIPEDSAFIICVKRHVAQIKTVVQKFHSK